MSTRQTPATDETTTASPRTDAKTAPDTTTADPAGTNRSWTDCCARQFSYRNFDRLRNLQDDENAAMHDGV